MRWLAHGLVAILFGVAALGVWHAVNNPAFWLEASALIVSALTSMLLPKLLERKPPEEEAEWRDKKKTGEEPNRPKHR